MSMIVFAALMMGQTQAPAAVPNVQPANGVQVTGKKPKQKCEFMEVTGSRTRQKVCRNEFGELDLGPNVTNAGANPGMLHATPGPAKGGFGGVPQ